MGLHLSAFILQRKLQNTLRRTRTWCLNYKKKNRIDWHEITNDLTTIQQSIISTAEAQGDYKMKTKTLEELQKKTNYWKQTTKNKLKPSRTTMTIGAHIKKVLKLSSKTTSKNCLKALAHKIQTSLLLNLSWVTCQVIRGF